MTDLRKIGLSALAGSLVAFSATAGEMSVSGTAKMSYTADTGNEDSQVDGNRFGMNQAVSFTGSGELDNGHTVTLLHVMSSDGGAKSTSALTYDMGDMGSLTYQQDSGSLGIGKIDDVMPTADEEVWNGLAADGDASDTALVGRVSGGVTGFNYTYSMDMVTINAGYSPKSDSDSTSDGSNGTAAALQSSSSVAVQIAPMDGLNVYAGTGTTGNSNGTQEDDHATYAVTYAYGPVTAGYQVSSVEPASGTEDRDTDQFGIAFAVNENLSVSYGEMTTEEEGTTLDQEVSGYSIGYSMGGITIKAHQNEAENISNAANKASEHTEIAVSFAF